jgi:hypothetical protein
LNVAADPANATAATGWFVTTGEDSTFKVTALVVVDPAELENVASNLKPFLLDEATKPYVDDVTPPTTAHLFPLDDSFHSTRGEGVPLAIATNSALKPALMVTAEG